MSTSMQRRPDECENMDHIRAEIDRIDDVLVDLVAERFGYVDKAWKIKQKQQNEGAVVPWRIQQVVNHVRERAAQRGVPPELAEALWRQMIGWFVQYEEEQLAEAADNTAPGKKK
ncbi:MAG: chorismate mutase [Alphaproteobacteria bacterium]